MGAPDVLLAMPSYMDTPAPSAKIRSVTMKLQK